MNPYLGSIAGYPIPVFAVVLDVALVIATIVATRGARQRGIAPTRFLDAWLLTLGSALVGSRLWYGLLHWDEFNQNPLTLIALWEGGLALPGAQVLGGGATVLAARVARASARTLLDVRAVGAALAEAIGRPGCIPAGCGAGKPADQLLPWFPSLLLPDSTGAMVERFPSQFFEAVAAAILFAVLFRMVRAPSDSRFPPGIATATYLMGSGIARLLLEPLRSDSTYWGAIATSSLWAIALLAAGGVSLWTVIHSRSGTGAPVHLSVRETTHA